MAQVAQSRMTLAAFLDWESRTHLRYELVDGIPVAMTGGTIAHKTIVGNIEGSLRSQLRKHGSKCAAFAENLKIITPSGRVTYPDGVVDCGEERRLSDTTLRHPTVIFEVFSKDSEEEDRGAKWVAYRALSTLQHYVMLSQTRASVEVYTKDPLGGWHLDEFEGLDSVLEFPVIGVTLALEDIYRDALEQDVGKEQGDRS